MEKISSKKVKVELTDEELMNVTGGYYGGSYGWYFMPAYGVGLRYR